MPQTNEDTMKNSQHTEQTTPAENDNISQFFNTAPEANLDETTEKRQKKIKKQEHKIYRI